jgi:hypothetical protein
MEQELRDLVSATQTAMDSIAAGNKPRMDDLALCLDKAESRLLELREGGATRRFHLQKLIQFFTFYHGTQSMGKALIAYGRMLQEIPRPS